MKILFHKLTDREHRLEIVRDDGSAEAVTCESRSYLEHDLLHYALEREAAIADGFWGSLAAGRTLEQMNGMARSGMTPDAAGALAAIEPVVGALTGLTKGGSPAEVVGGARAYLEALEYDVPAWLTEETLTAALARMRELEGRWRATARGTAMELTWT